MPTQGQPNAGFFILQFVLIIGIFYFIVIRPQRTEQKKHEEMLKKIAKNDEVITSGGIHGTVVNVKDKSLILRVDDNVKIEVERNCISVVTKSQAN